MQIIEILPLSNGAHRNQEWDLESIPEGYAVIPSTLSTPNFPFGTITVTENNGVMTVTSWSAGEIPETSEPEPQINEEDTTLDMLADHEYRLCMIELNTTE